MPDLLPDSRSEIARGSMWTARFGNCLPVFCANCGKEWGIVPESGMTFAFVLCPDCEKWGNIAHLMWEPDRVYWQRLADEQKAAEEKALVLDGGFDIQVWLRKQLENPLSPVAVIDREWQQRYRMAA